MLSGVYAGIMLKMLKPTVWFRVACDVGKPGRAGSYDYERDRFCDLGLLLDGHHAAYHTWAMSSLTEPSSKQWPPT